MYLWTVDCGLDGWILFAGWVLVVTLLVRSTELLGMGYTFYSVGIDVYVFTAE
ncbi:hypothetical protein ASPTUDRAFT_47820 [Aspergillus tubingensis CBS 134.48]|uniref:Uncharacterized protein n=1 Tax=Aspergillus tubingensis (strain CBS 134.48) TaxID=767770 RepID=A0A1L9MUY8_ASPTC|nr:hypothetical protein ASPTUDRAFT_47820 [Aspergillus tubingensis CBS 134.48]